MFWLELLVVLAALALGARLGGIFLGIAGGLGLAFLVFVFGLAPSAPPIDVILIVTAVIVYEPERPLSRRSGMDYLVSVAKRSCVRTRSTSRSWRRWCAISSRSWLVRATLPLPFSL